MTQPRGVAEGLLVALLLVLSAVPPLVCSGRARVEFAQHGHQAQTLARPFCRPRGGVEQAGNSASGGAGAQVHGRGGQGTAEGGHAHVDGGAGLAGCFAVCSASAAAHGAAAVMATADRSVAEETVGMPHVVADALESSGASQRDPAKAKGGGGPMNGEAGVERRKEGFACAICGTRPARYGTVVSASGDKAGKGTDGEAGAGRQIAVADAAAGASNLDHATPGASGVRWGFLVCASCVRMTKDGDLGAKLTSAHR